MNDSDDEIARQLAQRIADAVSISVVRTSFTWGERVHEIMDLIVMDSDPLAYPRVVHQITDRMEWIGDVSCLKQQVVAWD